MSDAPDLHRRLRAHGIDPGLHRPCRRCRTPRPITGYDGDRLSFVCRTPSCLAVGSPHAISVAYIQVACDGCGRDRRHQLNELSNGELVFICDGCSVATICGDTPEAARPRP